MGLVPGDDQNERVERRKKNNNFDLQMREMVIKNEIVECLR